MDVERSKAAGPVARDEIPHVKCGQLSVQCFSASGLRLQGTSQADRRFYLVDQSSEGTT